MRNIVFEALIQAVQSVGPGLRRALWLGGVALAAAYLVGCGQRAQPPGYQPISVTASGILPDGSVDVHITSQNGSFLDFGNLSAIDILAVNGVTTNGNSYDNTGWTAVIESSPPNDPCTIAPGLGYQVASATTAVGDTDGPVMITVVCKPVPATIGGIVTGLQLGNQLVLQDNGADNLVVVPSSGQVYFTFPTPIAVGSPYAVTVLSQTAAVPQNCPVTSGTGIVAGPYAATNILIACGADNYNLSATVSGLVPGDSMTLDDSQFKYGGSNDSLTFTANGLQNFDSPRANGAAYDVSVASQPIHETCTVTNGSGAVSGAAVNLTVTCVPTLYPVGVVLTGLPAGDSLTLQDNGADNLTITSNGLYAAAYEFNTQLPAGSTYGVSVLSEPPGESCLVTLGSGTIDPNNLGFAFVDCTAVGPNTQYNIGVTVTGLLPGQTLVLQNDLADNLTVQGSSSPVTMNFATSVGGNTAPYAITILQQPSGEGCSVGEGSGTISNSDVTIAVTCSAQISGIEVIPANPSAPVGTTQQFTALGLFTEGGTEDLSSQATWSSSDTGVAPINAATGLATIIAPGTPTIQAQVTVAGQPYAATTTLTATGSGVTLTSINVSPANATISIPGTLQYSAAGLFSNGNSVDISPWVAWSALPAGPASITATGLVTGIAAGSPTVSASLQPEGQALVSGNTGLTVSAGPAASCPAGPYTNPTYCGTVSATDPDESYSGTFYFTLVPSGGGISQVSTCSVTIAPVDDPTNSETIAVCNNGQVDSAGNLSLDVTGLGNFAANFTGTVVGGTTSGTLVFPLFPSGYSATGTFSGALQ